MPPSKTRHPGIILLYISSESYSGDTGNKVGTNDAARCCSTKESKTELTVALSVPCASPHGVNMVSMRNTEKIRYKLSSVPRSLFERLQAPGVFPAVSDCGVNTIGHELGIWIPNPAVGYPDAIGFFLSLRLYSARC